MEIIFLGSLEEVTQGSGSDDYDSPGGGYCSAPDPD